MQEDQTVEIRFKHRHPGASQCVQYKLSAPNSGMQSAKNNIKPRDTFVHSSMAALPSHERLGEPESLAKPKEVKKERNNKIIIADGQAVKLTLNLNKSQKTQATAQGQMDAVCIMKLKTP